MDRLGLAYGWVARSYAVYSASILMLSESLLDRWAKPSPFWVVLDSHPFLKFTGRVGYG